MAQMQKDNEREDAAYAQGFKDVLTDSLGMARGSEPNPYANFYASGGVVHKRNGGYFGEGDEYIDPSDLVQNPTAGLSYGLDSDNRYYIRPREGSGAERQSYLKGDFKIDPPTDYRHGFEEEFQFFDYIGDRDVPRELDTFGAGPSDYLAGLLAANLGATDAPSAPNTSPLSTYNTTKGSQFSGVDNFGDYGIRDLAPAPNLPDITDTVVDDTVVSGNEDNALVGGVDNTVVGTPIVDAEEEVVDTPDYISALRRFKYF